MTARARAAIVGCGAISREHLHVLGSHPRIELVGVCDRSPAAAAWTAQRYGTMAFTDHRLMLADARPDVVHVLTPPASHRTLTEDALRAGAHVIVEKPIASSLADLDAMLELARANDRLVIENHNYRFNDQISAIDALVADGVLGRIIDVDVLLCLELTGSKLLVAEGNPTGHLAGGAVRDFLTHLTYLAIGPFDGEPLDVTAQWWNRSGNPHVGADELDARIEFDDGVARLRFSSRSAPDCFRVTVRGTTGRAETDLYQPYLRVERRRGPQKLSPIVNHAANGFDLAASAVRNLGDKVLQHSAYHGLWTLLERFYAAILDGTPPPVSSIDVRRTNELVDRIVQSASTR